MTPYDPGSDVIKVLRAPGGGPVRGAYRVFGETLRGLLLYARGWSVVSTIALWAGIAAMLGFVIMLLVTIGDFVADPRIAAHHVAQA